MRTRFTLLLLALSVILRAQSTKLPADVDPYSYSRLPLVQPDQLDASGQRVYDFLNGKDQDTPRIGPTAAVLYSPDVGEPFEKFNGAERKTVAGTRYFEICTLIAAREFDQRYVWSAHELSAQRAGLERRVIDAIKFNRGVEDLADKDAALIRFGRDLFRQHMVSSTLYAQVVESFGRRGMVELAVILGEYAMTAVVLNAVDRQLPPGRNALLPEK
jgi:4-carboxymuconolactone decarboxylase